MISERDGHVRVLPLHVANKIAAGEVVERPASVVKELVENSIDAGARRISVSVTQGGRKLVAVQDDGCGMGRDDAVLCLERQATSKIRDVNDIEEIDTLGFRGEAIPSIASVSRFTILTRRADSDEGTLIQVNAGTLAEVRAAGCPAGTRIEVRDLFCNVPARRKFLRAYATEENHVKHVFTVHALAHPDVAFSLSIDGRELYRLAPAAAAGDRVRELFGAEFSESLLPLAFAGDGGVSVSGYVERPNLSAPSRRDQYVFVNGRPATAPAIAYALKEAYPRRAGDCRPAAIVFITLPPNQVDVNVHPTKREVRFRDNAAVRNAVMAAIGSALSNAGGQTAAEPPATPVSASAASVSAAPATDAPAPLSPPMPPSTPASAPPAVACVSPAPSGAAPAPSLAMFAPGAPDSPSPVAIEFALEPDSARTKPWQWFRFLAQAQSGYLLLETDAGIVTVNPQAARERIAYEQLLAADAAVSQPLLIPETVTLPPMDFARIKPLLPVFRRMGFLLEEFGRDTFKLEALPPLASGIAPSALLGTIAGDLADGGVRRGGARWREELLAKAVARAHAGVSAALTAESAARLVEELCACKMPYVCPRGKPVMIFTSNRELSRKFCRS